MRGIQEPAAFRFGRSYVIADSGCWEWAGALNSAGYGTFNPSPGKKDYAHRWAYLYVVGFIPGGMELDHLCRKPSCVNPNHLEPVTKDENLRRRLAAGVDHCKQGHAFTEANTYRPPGTNRRQCRTCAANRQRNRKHAAKPAA